MATRIVTVTELKSKLSTLMTELEKRGVPLYITQHGKPRAVLTSYEEYEALISRIEDLEDLIAMKESLAVPEKEAIPLKDYERKRSARLRN